MSDVAKSTQRIGDILDLIAQGRTPPSSKAIFEQLHLPRSSGYDLLSALQSRRFLHQRASGWVLSDEVHTLAMSRFGLGHIAHDISSILSALEEETEESAQLLVLENAHVRVMHVFSSLRTASISPEPHSIVPISWTAGGALFVTHLDPSALRRFFRAHAQISGRQRLAEEAQLWTEHVTKTKKRGYALGAEYRNPDAASVAAPVVSPEGKCLAVVSLRLPITRLRHCQDTLVSSVRAAAMRLTRGLRASKRPNV